MATSLADSPPASPPSGQAPSNGSAGPPHEPPAGASPAPPTARTCDRCGAAMAAGQDWCLECGAGAPGSLGTPSWRSAATIFGVVAVLALGAAAAAVAALTKSPAKRPVVIATVAQAPVPTTSTLTPATPTTPGAPGAPASTPKIKPTLPLGTVKPPKIPLTAVTPKASGKVPTTPSTPTNTSTPTSTTPAGSSPSGSGGEGTTEESQQAAILLDTNAANTYNPYGYPASEFGDPSLAIDGDTSTAWTAAVNPSTAPKMAEGLVIDMKDRQKVATLELVTSTPGMRIQVYGADGATAPGSITDPAWIPLSSQRTVKKKHVRIALRDASKAFTFITLWISQAPQSAAGTAEAPGHVDVNEIELFPAR